MYLSNKASIVFRADTINELRFRSPPKKRVKITFYAYKTIKFHANILGYNTG